MINVKTLKPSLQFGYRKPQDRLSQKTPMKKYKTVKKTQNKLLNILWKML